MIPIEIRPGDGDRKLKKRLIGLVVDANKQLGSGPLDLNTARNLALREQYLVLDGVAVDRVVDRLDQHYALQTPEKSTHDSLRNYTSLLGLEVGYGVNGQVAASDFNRFSFINVLSQKFRGHVGKADSRFGYFSDLCLGSTLAVLTELMINETQELVPELAEEYLTVSYNLIAGIFGNRNTELFGQMIEDDEPLKIIRRLGKLKLGVTQHLLRNSTIQWDQASKRITKILVPKPGVEPTIALI